MAGAACGAALASSLRLDALVPVPSLLPKAAGAQTVLLEVRIQQLPTTVRPDTFYKSISQDICLSLSLSLCFLLFFTSYLLKTKLSACQMSCVERWGAGAWGSRRLMSLGGEARVGAEGGSTTGHAPMGLLMLKHDQNKQTK